MSRLASASMSLVDSRSFWELITPAFAVKNLYDLLFLCPCGSSQLYVVKSFFISAGFVPVNAQNDFSAVKLRFSEIKLKGCSCTYFVEGRQTARINNIK